MCGDQFEISPQRIRGYDFRKHNVRVVQIEIQLSSPVTVTLRTDGPSTAMFCSGNHPYMDVGRVRPVTLCGSGGT